jgi:hypothetical protein
MKLMELSTYSKFASHFWVITCSNARELRIKARNTSGYALKVRERSCRKTAFMR